MKIFFNFILLSLLGIFIFPEIYSALAFGITLTIGIQILLKSSESFMFREWALFLYSVNYLLFPAITYQIDVNDLLYPMKIPSDYYFSIAIPMIILFIIGMYSIPNQLFKPNLTKVNEASTINKRILLNSTLIGIFLNLISSYIPGEFGFFIYLISMVRFVGAFALFSLDNKKYIYLVLVVLLLEIYNGFLEAMFHDAVMWSAFSVLFFFYIVKPSLSRKIIWIAAIIIFILFIQAFKAVYRIEIQKSGQKSDITTIRRIGSLKANSNSVLGFENLLGTLNRGNQAWIFSSTIRKMNSTNDFQGMKLVSRYSEVLLPRFLYKDKIKSGEKELFNKFSGHKINNKTSMALGVFADGYISFGSWGVYIFGFVLGLIFSLTFKLIESWAKVSPFYVLMLLPTLIYAVRPDCELQTIINHIAKSILVFGTIVFFSKYRFKLDTFEAKQKLNIITSMKKLDGENT